MQPTRREMLAGAATVALTSLAPPSLLAAPPADGLDAIARRRGLRFGSAIGMHVHSFDDPAYRALMAAQCGVMVPENELKWRYVTPDSPKPDFTKTDRLFAWAEQNHMLIRGHTLLWHRPDQFPKWMDSYDFGAKPSVGAADLLRGHIQAICRRYGRRIFSYDVVNETVDEKTGLLRETRLSQAMGGTEPLLDLAYRTARAEAPHAELVYNDYMSWESDGEKHRAGVLRLLEGFRKRGVPVDTLGLQSHIGPAAGLTGGDLAAQSRDWRAFLDAATGMGYKLIISEFDVDDRRLPPDIASRDAALAAYATAYLDLTLSYRGLHTVMCWGLVNPFSWLQTFKPRDDKLPKRPCPYDGDFKPTALHGAIARALASAPPRTA